MPLSHRLNSVIDAFKDLFGACFCMPVHSSYNFALQWKYEPAADRWILRRSNAIGAVPAIIGVAAFGGTVVGAIMLGWMSHNGAVFRWFVGSILILCLVMIIRLGASFRLVAHGDGGVVRIDCVYAAQIRVEECDSGAATLHRGVVKHPRRGGIKPYEARAGLWISFPAGPIVLVSGSEPDVDTYISTLPSPLRSKVQDSKDPLFVGYGPII